MERDRLKYSEEDEDTLAHSTKKFKENHYTLGEKENATDRKQGSYKDKLVGAIPSAFKQAFGFENSMHENLESDTEDDSLQGGSIGVLFSKEEKSRMRAPWQHALIIKPFGRKVSFSFLDAKIRSMWAPIGRMDCIDLGMDYFLINFELIEDMDKTLKGGPWFIGQ
nr:hypothetical protein CFP56_35263 [Quercus suber]